MFRAFPSASVSPLEVKCCASNHIHVSFNSKCSHILASANAAAKVIRSYGYLSSKVEWIKTTNHHVAKSYQKSDQNHQRVTVARALPGPWEYRSEV